MKGDNTTLILILLVVGIGFYFMYTQMQAQAAANQAALTNLQNTSNAEITALQQQLSATNTKVQQTSTNGSGSNPLAGISSLVGLASSFF